MAVLGAIAAAGGRPGEARRRRRVRDRVAGAALMGIWVVLPLLPAACVLLTWWFGVG